MVGRYPSYRRPIGAECILSPSPLAGRGDAGGGARPTLLRMGGSAAGGGGEVLLMSPFDDIIRAGDREVGLSSYRTRAAGERILPVLGYASFCPARTIFNQGRHERHSREVGQGSTCPRQGGTRKARDGRGVAPLLPCHPAPPLVSAPYYPPPRLRGGGRRGRGNDLPPLKGAGDAALPRRVGVAPISPDFQKFARITCKIAAPVIE